MYHCENKDSDEKFYISERYTQHLLDVKKETQVRHSWISGNACENNDLLLLLSDFLTENVIPFMLTFLFITTYSSIVSMMNLITFWKLAEKLVCFVINSIVYISLITYKKLNSRMFLWYRSPGECEYCCFAGYFVECLTFCALRICLSFPFYLEILMICVLAFDHVLLLLNSYDVHPHE